MRRYPFLPPGSDFGWTPYVWLIYLGFFFIQPLESGRALDWLLTGATLAIFLPLYFWGYWRPPRRALQAAVAIALLGTVLAPWNPGASVFFIYAGAYLGFAGNQRFALRCLGVLLIWIAAEAAILGLPPTFWIVALLFTTLVGGINVHTAEVSRRNGELKRSQEEVARLAKIAERERIGRDLHDLLGHTLSLVALKAELAGKLLGRDPDRAAAEIAEVERISREALREVRQAVVGYRSEGFAAEVERAAATLASAGIACHREIEPGDLPPAVERVLAFAVREAVTNVLRHSGATTCSLCLARRGDRVRLEIVDDGRGGIRPEGSGLAGMRERAEALGGSLERDGDGGTRLAIELPAAAEAEAATGVRGHGASGVAEPSTATGTLGAPSSQAAR